MCKLNVNTLPQVLVEQYLIEIAKNCNVPYKSTATIMAEAPADRVSVEFTNDVKKGALGNSGGTVAGCGDSLGASADVCIRVLTCAIPSSLFLIPSP